MDKNAFGFSDRLNSLARKFRARVAIGVDNPTEEIIEGLTRAKEIADVVVVGKKISGFESHEEKDSEGIAKRLIELVDAGEIDAIVRGQIHPRFLFLPLFQRMGMESSYFNGKKQVSMIIIENKKTKRFFVLGTVELGQGYDLEQKKYEAMEIAKYLESWGIKPYVGVMAMRRAKPKNAKPIKGYKPDPLIDRNYEYAEALTAYLVKERIKADFFDIEFETAILAGVNMLIPSIGQVGNAFARSLLFFSENWEIVSMLPLHFRPLVIQHSFKTGTGDLFCKLFIAATADVARKKYGNGQSLTARVSYD